MTPQHAPHLTQPCDLSECPPGPCSHPSPRPPDGWGLLRKHQHSEPWPRTATDPGSNHGTTSMVGVRMSITGSPFGAQLHSD